MVLQKKKIDKNVYCVRMVAVLLISEAEFAVYNFYKFACSSLSIVSLMRPLPLFIKLPQLGYTYRFPNLNGVSLYLDVNYSSILGADTLFWQYYCLQSQIFLVTSQRISRWLLNKLLCVPCTFTGKVRTPLVFSRWKRIGAARLAGMCPQQSSTDPCSSRIGKS